jgi:hypothetical protein
VKQLVEGRVVQKKVEQNQVFSDVGVPLADIDALSHHGDELG